VKKPSLSVSATRIKNKFGDYLGSVIRSKRPLLIERHGKPAAVLVDARKWAELETSEKSEAKAAAHDPWITTYEKLMKRLSKRLPKMRKDKSRKPGVSGLQLLRELREEIP